MARRMRGLLILAIHLIVTLLKLLRPGGVPAVAAESLLLKHQPAFYPTTRTKALCGFAMVVRKYAPETLSAPDSMISQLSGIRLQIDVRDGDVVFGVQPSPFDYHAFSLAEVHFRRRDTNATEGSEPHAYPAHLARTSWLCRCSVISIRSRRPCLGNRQLRRLVF